MNAGGREGRTLRAVLLERLIDEYGGEREDWTEMRSLTRVETAILDWLRAWLASDEVREVVSKYLLTEAMDGDFLVAAGRSIDNEGQDVPINKARTSEVAWWAVDAALTAVVGALAGEL